MKINEINKPLLNNEKYKNYKIKNRKNEIVILKQKYILLNNI